MTVLAQGCGPFDLGCQAGEAVDSAFTGIVRIVATGAADLVVSMSAWWVEQPSVNPLDDVIISAQNATRPLILMILVGGVLVQSIRIILSRKGEPAAMVATGLVRYALVSALGLTTLQLALRAGDALAADLLDGAVGNFAQLMQDLLTRGEGDGLFVVLLVALIAAVLSLVQWVLMALRQAGLLVLAAMLPLAASGSLTRSTRGWLDKIMVWLLAIVVYKPAAAFIYYVGFSYMSSASQDGAAGNLGTVLTGVVVLLLAVIAMPVLLKFFAWSGTQIGGGSGGGSGFLGAVGAVAMAGSPGRSAVDRAAAMETNGPGSYASFGQHPPMAMPIATGAVPAPGGAAPGTAAASGGPGGAAAAGGVAGTVVATGAAAAAGVRAAGRGLTGGADSASRAGGTPGGEPR
ncbi:MAG: hypothetical protein NTW05_11980 [Pseudonocardiales bacterium]|nr:hypothetical protein [Pseudonocardiales bacterium]